MSNRFGLYPCTFNNALQFNQLGSASLATGIQTHETFPAGSVYRKSALTAFAEPVFSITTEDIVTPFGAATVSPVAGYACSAASVFRYQQRTDGATFAVGSNHVLATCNKGFLAPTRLSASQDQAASCEFNFYALYDGSNLPVIFTNDQSLPSPTPIPTWNSTYFLGPAYIDDADTPLQLPTLVDMSIDFGIGYRVKRADGDVMARVGYIYRVAPSISLTFEKVSMLDNASAEGAFGSMFGEYFGTGGTNAAALSLSLYRGTTTGTGMREAPSDTDHCRIRIMQGEWHPDSVQVSDENDTTVTVTVRPFFDGTNAPIIIDATAAMV